MSENLPGLCVSMSPASLLADLTEARAKLDGLRANVEAANAAGLTVEQYVSGVPAVDVLEHDYGKFVAFAKVLREMGAVEASAYGMTVKFTPPPKSAPVAMDMAKIAAQLLSKRPAEATHIREPLDTDVPVPPPEPGSIEAKRAYHKSVLEQLNGA